MRQWVGVEQRFHFLCGNAEQGAYIDQQIYYPRLRKPVENIASIAARFKQVGIAQFHQLLGNIGLAQIEQSFQVANAGFAHPYRCQDLEPGRGADGPKYSADPFIGGEFCCIHNFEYILHYIRVFEYDKAPFSAC